MSEKEGIEESQKNVLGDFNGYLRMVGPNHKPGVFSVDLSTRKTKETLLEKLEYVNDGHAKVLKQYAQRLRFLASNLSKLDSRPDLDALRQKWNVIPNTNLLDNKLFEGKKVAISIMVHKNVLRLRQTLSALVRSLSPPLTFF